MSTPRIFTSLGASASDAANCPLCNAPWDFATTWLGELRAIHPITRCVPKPVVVYEKEGDTHESAYETKCDECGKWFTPRKYAGNSQVVCGDACRKVRRDRKHRESEKRCKRAA